MRVSAVLIAATLAACSQKSSGSAKAVDAAATTPRAQGLIEAASHGKVEGLQRAVRKKDLTEAEVLAIIHAIPDVPPPGKGVEIDPQAAVADVIGEVEPRASYVEPLIAAARAVRDDTRWYLLWMLVAQPGGIDAFFPLAREMGDASVGGFAHLWARYDRPKLDASQISDLLELSAFPGIVDDVAGVALRLTDEGDLDAAALEPYRATFLVDYQRVRREQVALREAHPLRYVDDLAYRDAAGDVNTYLDLFKYFDSGIALVGPVLDDAMKDDDLLTATYAITSNGWLRRDIDRQTVALIASYDQLRTLLYGHLAAAGRAEVVPAEWRTQEMLARADLHQWITWRAERPPPLQIEPLEVIGEFHVLRFRETVDGPWMGAVAGAYPAEGGPHAYGTITGSMYEPVGDQTPEEILARWQAYNEDSK